MGFRFICLFFREKEGEGEKEGGRKKESKTESLSTSSLLKRLQSLREQHQEPRIQSWCPTRLSRIRPLQPSPLPPRDCRIKGLISRFRDQIQVLQRGTQVYLPVLSHQANAQPCLLTLQHKALLSAVSDWGFHPGFKLNYSLSGDREHFRPS